MPNVLVPIAYLTRRLNPAERNYWPTKLQMAGLVLFIKNLKGYIKSEAMEIEFLTDHISNSAISNMKSINTTSAPKSNSRHQNWAVCLSQYWPQLVANYHKGTEMQCPDALSRLKTKLRQET